MPDPAANRPADHPTSTPRPDPIRVRAAAVRYLTAEAAIDNAPPCLDDDPRISELLDASDEFTDAIGFGFAAETDEVAELLVAVIAERTE
jgi:hypothetical protein